MQDLKSNATFWTYRNFGDFFATADPRLWNSLPAGLKQTNISYEQF